MAGIPRVMTAPSGLSDSSTRIPMPSPVKRAALIGAANRARQRLPPIEFMENLVSLGKVRRHLDCERVTSGQGVLALSIMAGEEWLCRIHLIDKRSRSHGLGLNVTKTCVTSAAVLLERLRCCIPGSEWVRTGDLVLPLRNSSDPEQDPEQARVTACCT